LNTANRSFALVVATAAAPYGLLLLASCGFGAYLVDQVGDGGYAALGRGLLLPAAVLLLVLLTIGLVAGIVAVVQQVSATRRLVEHVEDHRTTPPSGAPSGVEVIDDDEPFAFTFGLGDPRIAMSRGLIEQLSPAELDAVVVHESYHVRARDPLKLVVARTAARTCFFLPAIGHLVARYVAGRELAADRRSLRDPGRPALAGALYKVVAGPAWGELDTAAAMAGAELLAVRVDQLELGVEPDLPALPRGALAVSAAVLATLTGIVSALALRGGLSMMSPDASEPLSGADVAGVVACGAACMAGWAWLAAAAFRSLDRHP